jgi:hypothetical protein
METAMRRLFWRDRLLKRHGRANMSCLFWRKNACLPFVCRVLTAALLVTLVSMSSAWAATICTGGYLDEIPDSNMGEDLEVIGECYVREGQTYHYGDVNIYNGGALMFDDPHGDQKIHFWAKSILVEKDSSLIIGTPGQPIGDTCQAARDRSEDIYCGRLITIHLYGEDQGLGGKGIRCKTNDMCGAEDIWTSNPTVTVNLPGGVNDYFYKYGTLPVDNGDDKAYFGYKVLGVSYGGTLQLTGRKGRTDDGDRDPDPSYSGTSWVRLAEDLPQNGTRLVLNRKVSPDWEPGDKIVVTTTDYLPGHSEELTIKTVSDDGKTITVEENAEYRHSGTAYALTAQGIGRLKLDIKVEGQPAAETRAAVALLTRSICIRSEGDAYGQSFPAESTGYHFGGHTMARQGFESYQVQGVEFFQMGQGGRKGHYPVHLHMARETPHGTYVKDCSVNESMTRWITLHGTQDVTLARNVGYKSIGHGYYLEDGTEINNTFYSNIGIFARAAIDNPQNPRKVPGILAYKGYQTNAFVPYNSDNFNPTVFWIMNGWNDFQYNMAVGAGACGTCYWLVPGANSGPSQGKKWESYASMQSGPFNGEYEVNLDRAGMTPLKSFIGNYCSSAMMSFNTVGATDPCYGVSDNVPGDIRPIPSEYAPAPKGDPIADLRNPETFYPKVTGGGGRFATRCDGNDCSNVNKCAAGDNRKECMVTVLDRYTSSFHWPEQNFAAIWLRPQWYLFINSVLSDTQNGGLGFVTGGDYTESNLVPGQWQLARKSVFIGHTQKDNPLASNAGPFVPGGLTCDDKTRADRCYSLEEGISMPLANWAVNQRLFNIYDGPNYQDSNAYLDIEITPLGSDCKQEDCPQFGPWMYTRSIGIPVDHTPGDTFEECVLPNAAIGWKQPNGFFYPPAFHSSNLFFHNVDIRHYVLEPLWEPGTYVTDEKKLREDYCRFNAEGSFGNFSSVDRQTVLNDDDGSLTGLVSSERDETISVNLDPFFFAPIEATECRSFETANTSPYEYVSTVVYPDCAAKNNCVLPPDENVMWSAACTNANCYGVPLERQLLTKLDDRDNLTTTGIRMAGMAIFQRSMLTLNNATYYMDTTVSKKTQTDSGATSFNVFEPGESYYILLIYAKPNTKQTYQIYVGGKRDGEDPDFDPNVDVEAVRARLTNPLSFTREETVVWVKDHDPTTGNWARDYNPDTGILTVTMDLANFAGNFQEAKEDFCQPESFCELKGSRCQCSATLKNSDPVLYNECMEGNICGTFAGKDIDCPMGGCLGFKVTLASEKFFETDDDKTHRPEAFCFKEDATWKVLLENADWGAEDKCADTDTGTDQFCMDE